VLSQPDWGYHEYLLERKKFKRPLFQLDSRPFQSDTFGWQGGWSDLRERPGRPFMAWRVRPWSGKKMNRTGPEWPMPLKNWYWAGILPTSTDGALSFRRLELMQIAGESQEGPGLKTQCGIRLRDDRVMEASPEL
jgi:hypothetical protein